MFTCNRNVFENLKQKLCSSRYYIDQKSHNNFGTENEPHSWRWNSRERSFSTSGNSGQPSEIDKAGEPVTSSKPTGSFPPTNPHSQIPSRYGSRSKTMYTLSKTQASDTALNINSFNGRYY